MCHHAAESEEAEEGGWAGCGAGEEAGCVDSGAASITGGFESVWALAATAHASSSGHDAGEELGGPHAALSSTANAREFKRAAKQTQAG